MADNLKVQQYLQTIKDEIHLHHVVCSLSINECHRILVHHRDPWFSYSQLDHAIRKWKHRDPLTWKPASSVGTSGFGLGQSVVPQNAVSGTPSQQAPTPLSMNQTPKQDLGPMVQNGTHQQVANQLLSVSGVPLAGPSVTPQLSIDAMSWVGSEDIGTSNIVTPYPEHHQLSLPLPYRSSVKAI